jgi:hypothetical protein
VVCATVPKFGLNDAVHAALLRCLCVTRVRATRNTLAKTKGHDLSMSAPALHERLPRTNQPKRISVSFFVSLDEQRNARAGYMQALRRKSRVSVILNDVKTETLHPSV